MISYDDFDGLLQYCDWCRNEVQELFWHGGDTVCLHCLEEYEEENGLDHENQRGWVDPWEYLERAKEEAAQRW